MSAGLFNTIVAVVTLVRPLPGCCTGRRSRSRASPRRRCSPSPRSWTSAFIVFSPIIILLLGFGAPLAMLALCLLAILTGFAISYNINNNEPLIGKPDPLHRWNSFALWAPGRRLDRERRLLRPAADDAGVAAVGRPLLARTRHRFRRGARQPAIGDRKRHRVPGPRSWPSEAGDRLAQAVDLPAALLRRSRRRWPRRWVAPLFTGIGLAMAVVAVARYPDLSRGVCQPAEATSHASPFTAHGQSLSEVRAPLTARLGRLGARRPKPVPELHPRDHSGSEQ